MTHTTLTVQHKRASGAWVDSSTVVVLNPEVLEETIQLLIAELPKETAARVKVVHNGVISYRW